MASYIERRKFLATLGGAAAWPLGAQAQQPQMRVIEFLSSGWLPCVSAGGRHLECERSATYP
jgi:hypothetical protein